MSTVVALGVPLYVLGLAVVARQLERGGALDAATAWHVAPLVPKPTVALQAVRMFFSMAVLGSTIATVAGAATAWWAAPRIARARGMRALGRFLRRPFDRALARLRVARPRLYFVSVLVALLVVLLGLIALVGLWVGVSVAYVMGSLPTPPAEPWQARTGLTLLRTLSGTALALPLYQNQRLFRQSLPSWVWERILPRRWVWALAFGYAGNLLGAYYTAPATHDFLPPITITTNRATVRGALIGQANGYWYVLMTTREGGIVRPIANVAATATVLGASR